MNRPNILTSCIRDVQFGERVRVVDPVNIYECTIGNDCFISHGAMFVNDLVRALL